MAEHIPADAYLRQRMELATDSDCWLWTGVLDRDGYGITSVSKKTYGTRRAHRLAYMAWVDYLPEDLTVDHLCFTRNCLNPAHLRAVPHEVNARRQRPHKNASGVRILATECPRGHARDRAAEAARGATGCIECQRARERRYNEKRKAKRRAAA